MSDIYHKSVLLDSNTKTLLNDHMDTKKSLTIVNIVITISVIMIMGLTNSADPIKPSNLQCGGGIHLKLFDDKIMPKYIIESGYKITPVNPATTDVLVDKCNLLPTAIS